MKAKEEYIELLKDNTPYLKEKFNMTELCLFGSVARNEHHEGSDVDLFVSMPGVFYLASEANDFLESLLGCRVDLIRDRGNISEFMREEVKKDGIKIF